VADLLMRIRTEIDDRLDKLRPLVEEIPRLEAALAALDAQGAKRTRPARSTTPPAQSARRPGRRAPRGQNRARVLTAIEERPGASPGEIANASGVKRTVVYNVIRALVDDGFVKRTGDRGVELSGKSR
jgi:hypothetical protein